MVGILFPSLRVGAEPSRPFVKYLSVSTTCVLLGNASASNFKTLSLFHIQKSISRSHSRWSSKVFGLVLPSSTSSSFPSVAQLQLHYPHPAGTILPPLG